MNFMFQKETEKIQKMLEEQDYVADPSILMSVYLAEDITQASAYRGPGRGWENRNCQSYGKGLGNGSDSTPML